MYKFTTALLTLLFFSATTNAQLALGWGWGKTIGGTNSERLAALATDSRNGVYVFGHFSGSISFDGQVLTSAGGSDMYLIKYDTTGNLVWAKRYGGTANEEAKDLKCDRSGNLILTGNFEGTVNFGGTTLTSAGAGDVCIVKLRPDGTVTWAKQFTGTLDDKGGALICDNQRNIYTTGTYASNDLNIGGTMLTAPKTYNTFYCKLDSNGNRIWAKQSNSNTSFSLYSFDLLPGKTLLMHGGMANGGVDRVNFDPAGIPGATGLLSINRAIFTVKMDTAGNYFSQTITNNIRAGAGGTTLTLDKRVITAGTIASLTNPAPKANLDQIDSNSVLIRDKSFGPGQSALYNIATSKNGKHYAVGFSAGNNNFDAFALNVSGAAFLFLELDDILNVKGLLSAPVSNISNQSLTKIAIDTTTEQIFTAGTFSGTGNSFTVGNNTMPYYGSDDVFIGQVKYMPPILRAYAGNDTTVCAGVGTAIGLPTGATGGIPPYNYSWSPTTGISNPASPSIIATPLTTTVYILTVTDVVGNTAKDTTIINIIPAPPIPTITQLGNILSSSAATGNQWNLNGNPLPGATGQTYAYTTGGNYTVTVTNSNGCSSSSATLTALRMANSSLGNGTDFYHQVAPNPINARSAATLQYQLMAPATVSIQITDRYGQQALLLVPPQQQVAGMYTVAIGNKLQVLSKGLYYIVYNIGGKRVTEEIVIQ